MIMTKLFVILSLNNDYEKRNLNIFGIIEIDFLSEIDLL